MASKPAKKPTKSGAKRAVPQAAIDAVKGKSINAEADAIINGDRREDYGPAKESFEKIATGWEVIFDTVVTPHQVALAMIWLKEVRALQKFDRDSFVDICGYAGLAEDIA